MIRLGYTLIIAFVFIFISCDSKTDNAGIKKEEIKKEIEFKGEPVKKELGRIPHDPVSGIPKGKKNNYFKIFSEMIKKNPQASEVIITYERYFDESYSRFEKVIYERNYHYLQVMNAKTADSDYYYNLDDSIILNKLKSENLSTWDVLRK